MIRNKQHTSILSDAMVAYHLKEDYEGGLEVEILSNFNYREDNPYFAELYLKEEYFDGDEQPVSYWGTTYLHNRRNEELHFLRLLFNHKLISNLVISYGDEEDVIGLGHISREAKKYSFKVTEQYLDILNVYIGLANQKVLVDCKLIITDMLVPIIDTNQSKYKFKALSGDHPPGLIIEHCFNESPDKVVTLQTLIAKISLNKKANIKDKLHNTVFDTNNGPLRNFVEVTPSRIKLLTESKISLSDLLSGSKLS